MIHYQSGNGLNSEHLGGRCILNLWSSTGHTFTDKFSSELNSKYPEAFKSYNFYKSRHCLLLGNVHFSRIHPNDYEKAPEVLVAHSICFALNTSYHVDDTIIFKEFTLKHGLERIYNFIKEYNFKLIIQRNGGPLEKINWKSFETNVLKPLSDKIEIYVYDLDKWVPSEINEDLIVIPKIENPKSHKLELDDQPKKRKRSRGGKKAREARERKLRKSMKLLED